MKILKTGIIDKKKGKSLFHFERKLEDYDSRVFVKSKSLLSLNCNFKFYGEIFLVESLKMKICQKALLKKLNKYMKILMSFVYDSFNSGAKIIFGKAIPVLN